MRDAGGVLKIDRAELSAFLRIRRERLRPEDLGLPANGRRRTAGLRREEVAMLAGMSVDYYTRLEQARGPQPSAQVLGALSRALRLTRDEHDHLFHLSGVMPEDERRAPTEHVRPGVLHLLDKLDDTPALVVSDRGDMLAWNAMQVALMGDPGRFPAEQRNIAWQHFCNPEAAERFLPEDLIRNGENTVADLRARLAAHPDDAGLRTLVEELRVRSQRFADLWERHDVRRRRMDHKTVLHPVVGRIDLDCEVMFSPEHDQRLIIHSARAGTPAAQALQLLRVIGTQSMAEANT
ncbi:helix-turn-helix domain-containing protein [Catenulispora sp. NF23]|uniref:Helix-turn-helix domain-containing protein n=1 Tax=Catenulispora pinistramenti TaxID=2705254 RepID=A0ABS5L4M2_9ACTN|nr:helix-turn-helix domain-containing protein [Catenulispora pinistramenti]MBS2553172.1 helix-turn-helix domain-containing protein [Catenulispora pinistramenti]